MGKLEKIYPKEIIRRMLEEQVMQGNARNKEVFEKCVVVARGEGGFTWCETVDGSAFWSRVIDSQIYDDFFKKYPKDTEVKHRVLRFYLKWQDREDCTITIGLNVIYLVVRKETYTIGYGIDIYSLNGLFANIEKHLKR